MLMRYKVLGAMLALREFTVADLARFSSVKVATVRTVLNRESQFWERVDAQEAPKRGGQYRQYRVKADQVAMLQSGIEGVFQSLGVPDTRSKGGQALKVPLGILAAEDRLLRLFPEAGTPEERREILRLAHISLEGGRAQAEALLDRDPSGDDATRIQTHLKSAEGLRELCKVELGEHVELSFPPTLFAEIADSLGRLGESDQAFSLLGRVVRSSVWSNLVSRWAEVPCSNNPLWDEVARTRKRKYSIGPTTIRPGQPGSTTSRVDRFRSLVRGLVAETPSGTDNLRSLRLRHERPLARKIQLLQSPVSPEPPVGRVLFHKFPRTRRLSQHIAPALNKDENSKGMTLAISYKSFFTNNDIRSDICAEDDLTAAPFQESTTHSVKKTGVADLRRLQGYFAQDGASTRPAEERPSLALLLNDE